MIKKLFWKTFDFFDRHFKFGSVVRKGDTVVQVGVDGSGNGPRSSLWQMAKLVGPTGLAIGIEPDPVNFKIVQEQAKLAPCRVILVNKATYSTSGKMIFRIGKIVGDNELKVIRGDISLPIFSETAVEVDVDTVDNILESLGVPFEKVSHINLTNNGAEFETLKGMRKLMEKSPHLSINVISGRQGEKQSVGLEMINGKPDYVALQEFFAEHGFRSKFVRASSLIWEGIIKTYLFYGLWGRNFDVFGRVLAGAVLAKKGDKAFRFYESYANG